MLSLKFPRCSCTRIFNFFRAYHAFVSWTSYATAMFELMILCFVFISFMFLALYVSLSRPIRAEVSAVYPPVCPAPVLRNSLCALLPHVLTQ